MTLLLLGLLLLLLLLFADVPPDHVVELVVLFLPGGTVGLGLGEQLAVETLLMLDVGELRLELRDLALRILEEVLSIRPSFGIRDGLERLAQEGGALAHLGCCGWRRVGGDVRTTNISGSRWSKDVLEKGRGLLVV